MAEALFERRETYGLDRISLKEGGTDPVRFCREVLPLGKTPVTWRLPRLTRIGFGNADQTDASHCNRQRRAVDKQFWRSISQPRTQADRSVLPRRVGRHQSTTR
jgi:hypothetical protein